MLTTMGFYEILQVDPASHERTLKRAFTKLARIYHPDNGGDLVRFKIIKFVYEVPADSESRRIYDERGRAAFEHQFPTGQTLPTEETRMLPVEERQKLPTVERQKLPTE